MFKRKGHLMVDGDLLVAAGRYVHPRSAVRGEELAQVVDEDVHWNVNQILFSTVQASDCSVFRDVMKQSRFLCSIIVNTEKIMEV